ncbi:CidA/LrgA family protein [Thiobacter aerophilum]|uniref:CidA/LrgA family protein n=1 Tax=Thiobacter aerophilum TaxID=3121275 RepID=A0ABV0EIP8_9BURK
MLGALTLLLLFQLAGEVLVQALALPVPGPVVGMALLLTMLVLRGGVPQPLSDTANGVLSHLSILFVPGGVGVMLYLPRLREEWLPIVASLVLGTLLTLTATALVLRALHRRQQDKEPRP